MTRWSDSIEGSRLPSTDPGTFSAPVERTKPHRGTIAQRRAWTAARRDEWHERDKARFRAADELAAQAQLSIPHDQGFLVVPPGVVPEAAPVVEAANELIDSIGHDRLVTKYNKKNDTMARGFLRADASDLDSPYMRFALSESVIAPVAAYLGLVPILFGIDAWYSPPATESGFRNAQLWHADGDDTAQVKVWVHLNDIGPESGPLTVLPAARTEAFANEIGYDTSVEYRLPDQKVDAFVGDVDIVQFAGPVGTVDFVDTSGCLHLGSRVEPDAPARRVFMAQYLTPYAFKFERDHREEAPYRDLASSASSELESLVLGAS
jgi:hypothetical protein